MEGCTVKNPDSFLFASYARPDAKLVQTDMASLSKLNCKFYMNELIRPGPTWHDELTQIMQKAEGSILYMSPAYFASPYCIQELGIALNKGKPLIVVHLRKTVLPSWFVLLASKHTSIFPYLISQMEYLDRMRKNLQALEELSPHRAVAN